MIIFDFDGVISNSIEVCTAACQHAANRQQAQVIMESNPFRDLNPVTFESLAIALGLEEKKFADDVAHYMYQYGNDVPFFDGMDNVIKTLSQQYKLFIVSASHSDTIQAQLSAHRLTGYFEMVLGGDMPGTKTEKIALLQRDQQIQSIVIGDSVSDVIAANENNANSIAVSWGWQSQDFLEKMQPTYVIHSPAELISTVSLITG